MKLDSYNHSTGYKALITHVIIQAVMELGSSMKKRKREAREFLKSEDCRLMCSCIDFDYSLIEGIQWDNPRETLNLDFRLKDFKNNSQIIDDYIDESFILSNNQ